MSFSLTKEQQALYDRFCEASAVLQQGASGQIADPAFCRDRWQHCADIGLTGLVVPPDFGGQGLDAIETTAALEAFGYTCDDNGLVFSVGAHLLACVVPILRFGTDEQKQHYLPRLCDGRWVGANAMTEAASGSDAMSLQTVVAEDGDNLVIDGSKVFVTNGPIADLVLIFAALKTDPSQVFAILLETDQPGVSIGPAETTMGLGTASVGQLTLDAVRVKRTAMLGRPGAALAIFQTAMNWERTGLFAAHMGTATRLLERGIDRARTHERFGCPLGDFQAISHKLVNRRMQIESARLLVYKAAAKLGSGQIDPTWAAMAKVAASEVYVQTATDVLEVFGGEGYLSDTGLDVMLRDAIGSKIYSGTNDVLKNLIARWMGL